MVTEPLPGLFPIPDATASRLILMSGSHTNGAQVTVVRCVDRDGVGYDLDRPVSEIAAMIADRRPVIIRGLASESEVALVRSHCMLMNERMAPSNPPVTRSSRNYHRINLNPERSSVKSVNHVYRFFYWDSDTDAVAEPFRRAMRLRNAVSGLPADYAEAEITDGFVAMPFVSHYPRGGGGMQEHRDPVSRQQVVVIVNLSRHGVDFTEGGLYFVDDRSASRVLVDPLMRPGDAFLFHPQTAHGVLPVDSGAEVDWTRPDGRWMFTSSLVSVASLNGADYTAAGQPT